MNPDDTPIDDVNGMANLFAGACFRSKDEAALAWGIENAHRAQPGKNEWAGTIYSETNLKGKKTYSYNGSFEGGKKWSNFHKDERPPGSRIEGLIHLHPIQPDFSTHREIWDSKIPLDTDIMDKAEYIFTDFYLVNNKGELKVSRGAPINTSGPTREPSKLLASGLKTRNFNFNVPNWLDANNNPVNQNNLPELIKKYIQAARNGK